MFSYFFSHFGIGLLASMLLVPYRRLGSRFFTVNVLLALVFLVLSTATRTTRGQRLPVELVVCLVLAVAYTASIRLRRNRLSPILLVLAVGAGLGSIARDAAGDVLLTAHFVTSALLLGAVTLDMVLGHFYLVIPGLDFAPLRRLTLFLGWVLGLRILVIVWGLVGSWEAWMVAWRPDSTGFLLQYGFLLTLRLLFGIAFPVVLVILVWQCVRIRSNQSATGILYVATVAVLIGEIASRFFLTTPVRPL